MLAVLADAVAHAPENAAYGLLAFAALGADFGPIAMGLALIGTVVSNAVASMLGAGRLVSGQRAALSLLTAALVTALVPLLGPQGPASVGWVLMLCVVAVVGAGSLQLLFGLLKLGNIVKYTPHPVRTGVTSGVGLLLIVTALPVLTGHGFGAGWRAALHAPQVGAILVGLSAVGVSRLVTRLRLPVPPVLVGFGIAGLLHLLLVPLLPPGSLGTLIGDPVLPYLAVATFDANALLHSGRVTTELLALLGVYALTVAVLCSLDTLLAVSVVDARFRDARDPNRELRGQGLATIAAGLACGHTLSPSIPKSLALAQAAPRQRHAVLFYALGSLLLLLAAPRLIGLVPTSAIGGVLLLQGVQMIAPEFWRAPQGWWRQARQRYSSSRGEPAPERQRGGDWAIESVVAISAVVFGLGPAVVIGAACAVLLFVRANMRDVVRREWTAQTRRSLKARPSHVVEALAREGSRITLLELEGPLFFGTADGLRARLDRLETSADTVILDLHRVTEIDVTAARILSEVAEHWSRLGRHLVFSECRVAGQWRRSGDVPGGPTGLGSGVVATTDMALEQAEERLLAKLDTANVTGHTLALGDTLLGRGLSADELAWLAGQMESLEFPRGHVLFRLGDPGDGFFISLAGDIGLRMPGTARRLASFAPGVVIGEMATLTRGVRSAEAYAESDVTAIKLSADDFDRLMIERPVLAAKVLKSMALHLGDRVRTLTGDLSHWAARADANH
jgi:SulP family sulfate permease